MPPCRAGSGRPFSPVGRGDADAAALCADVTACRVAGFEAGDGSLHDTPPRKASAAIDRTRFLMIAPLRGRRTRKSRAIPASAVIPGERLTAVVPNCAEPRTQVRPLRFWLRLKRPEPPVGRSGAL
jgi:hypothetical protein